jgi:acetyl-CoA carboxylase biotin carboxyl carrier protein
LDGGGLNRWALMDLPQIKRFIDAMASSDLTELEASKDGWTLRLLRGGKRTKAPRARGIAGPPPRSSNDEPQLETSAAAFEICAPLSGIVYLQPSPNQPPFVVVGQAIKAGTAVCVIEAMKTLNEIRAEHDGTVETVLVASETMVEAGQPLIRVI